ncbi:hypothetical protein [Xylanibacter ruminicola]|uniref:Uncharacterized protein n=1 Tax=Xylanibacter ruminicola TaxID=839 RepID=A0A1M6RM32_XYLRU|nr:hypothetical protein [Xylanibacter ruminicola]SHK33512.1 hypothetical protein SAMN05216463_10222 [Xylanibacter ruminicola]
MKRLLLLTCLGMWLSYASADNYKVLFVNDASLTYNNGKAVKVGDTFTNVDAIKWQKEKQAIKVFNLTTKKQMLMLGKQYMRKTGMEALISSKRLSTNDFMDTSDAPKTIYEKLGSVFESQYDLLDPIELPADVELNDKCYFQATYKYGDTMLTKKLKSKNGNTVILDKSIFEVDGRQLGPRDITLSIEYVNKDAGLPIFVKDGIEVTYIPTNLNE